MIVSAYIYGLAHPRTKIIRYVGKTILPLERRLIGHICSARRRPKKGRLHTWILDLASSGSRPVIVKLATVRLWRSAERRWILRLRNEGRSLLNCHAGGNGGQLGRRLPIRILRLLGKISDQRVAEKVGLTREAIRYHRTRLAIPASHDRSRCRGHRLGAHSHNYVEFSRSDLRSLGTDIDAAIGRRLGVSKTTIGDRRKILGIAPFSGPPKRARGVKHHCAKLTPREVRAIRAYYRPRTYGRGTLVLSRMYGLNQTTVHAIVRRRIWKDVK